ncbi:MAG TPA: ferredoxin reductase [Microthrixaceae bacterium]|nr:ferredoxin reductase [Microthrixaceae bacterium]
MSVILERLASPLNVDAFLSTFNPLWGAKLQGVIERVVPLTADSASIQIKPGRSWKGHIPGQFVTLGVDIGGVRHHRCFSLTSTPGRGGDLIEVSVHCAADGFVSRHLVNDAKPGDVVQLSQAEGEFTLSCARADRKLLFVTGGSGITPVMGMLRTLVADQNATADVATDIVLLHHSRTSEQMMFRSELEALAERVNWLRLNSTFTADGGSHLDADRLDRECPDWADRDVYVCGPTPMLDFVQSHWYGAGVGENVHVERFVLNLAAGSKKLAANKKPATNTKSGSSSHKNSSESPGATNFGRSGVVVESDPTRPLLEVAEAAGLAPVFGCRMGICHTCTTRLDEGCVTDLRDGRVSEAGSHVQICVSSAADDVLLDL